MIKIGKKDANKFVLRAGFAEDKIENVAKKQYYVTEFIEKKEAYICVGKKEGYNYDGLKAAANAIATLNTREFQIDVQSFVSDKVTEELVVKTFVEVVYFVNAKLWNLKTDKNVKPKKELELIELTSKGEERFKKSVVLAEARNWTRTLQTTPPNVLNSEVFAEQVKKEFSKYSNLSVKVLNKAEITKLKMGLLLSVNLGSKYEPRVVIVEYKGDPSSKEKTVLVGKGITFDAGGYSIKTGRFMTGMKYDMSGAAIASGSMKAIAQLKPKANYSIVLVMTDNMINSGASTPDAVFTSMNGKTVEINNTDAEGRLALADGLTYAIRKLNATRVMDIATLTGAVVSALGSTYTGVWATQSDSWKELKKASRRANEHAWRMPFHKDYIKYMKGSDVADLKNTDFTGKGGSSSAAMFLKEFTEGKDYMHFDVAGTADAEQKPMGVMIRTIVELIEGSK